MNLSNNSKTGLVVKMNKDRPDNFNIATTTTFSNSNKTIKWVGSDASSQFNNDKWTYWYFVITQQQ